MRILFICIDLNIDAEWQGSYHKGIAILSSILKSKNHYVKLEHLYNLKQSNDINKRISTDFDLIAFSCTTPMFPLVQYLSKKIKKQFKNIPLLCGGPHATSAPSQVLKNSYIDYVCIGEGEYFMLDFLEYLQGKREKRSIKNLAYRGSSGQITVNELRPPINPLDELPFPDTELFDSHIRNSDSASLFAGRGCPYECAYCSNSYFNKIYKNKFLRFKKPETVIREIKFLIHKYPHIKQIHFSDSVFITNTRWLSDFCRLYKNSFNLPFSCTAHPMVINDENMKLLKGSGCNKILFGIQSGNEFIRNKIMLRRVSDKKTKESIEIVKKYKLDFTVDIIFGVPLEKKIHMLDTIKICAETNIKTKSHIYYPLPATKLEELSIKMGLLNKGVYGEDYHSKTILNYSKLHKARILFFHRYAESLVSIYRVFGYSRIKFFPRKIRLYILDNFLCNDLIIYSIIMLRSKFIDLRSLMRKLHGINDYKLTRLEKN